MQMHTRIQTYRDGGGGGGGGPDGDTVPLDTFPPRIFVWRSSDEIALIISTSSGWCRHIMRNSSHCTRASSLPSARLRAAIPVTARREQRDLISRGLYEAAG